jgi:hypothetical protein
MLKAVFLGDIALNDNYHELTKKNINPFSPLSKYFFGSDFVVGNLECLLSGINGENQLKKPRLKMDVASLKYLKDINLNVACLANNHVFDHLEDGYSRTTAFLEKNNIRYIGAGFSETEAENHLILEKDGLKIGILNYVTEDTHPSLPLDSKFYVNYLSLTKILSNIKLLRKEVDQIILVLHWGGRVEGGFYPDHEQSGLARKLIDAGADLIIGHHSHTIHPFEVYKNKYIFYSLGNFCFTDYVFENEIFPLPERRKISLIVGVEFSRNNYRVYLNVIKNNFTSYKILNNYILRIKIRNFIFKYFLSYRVTSFFYYKYIKYILPLYLFIIRSDLKLLVKMSRIYLSIRRRIL